MSCSSACSLAAVGARHLDRQHTRQQVMTAGTKVLPRRLRQLANEAVVTEDGPHPAAKARANSAGVPASSSPAVPLACHSRRSRPVLSGQPRTTPRRLHLHRSLPTRVTTLPDLALQAGSRLVKALIGLAVPGRPIQSLVAGGPERQRRPRPDGTGASRARGGPGPCWVRTVSGTAGPRRARGVTAGMRESQVTEHSCLQPRRVRRGGAGFEPLTQQQLGLRPLPTRQVVIADGPSTLLTPSVGLALMTAVTPEARSSFVSE
jgi:hypothetical protein